MGTRAHQTKAVERLLSWLQQREDQMAALLADLIAIPFAGKLADAIDAVVHHVGDVSASIIDGEWIMCPPEGRSSNGIVT